MRLLRDDDGLEAVAKKSGRRGSTTSSARVPIRLIHDRWINKYTEPTVKALVDMKTRPGRGIIMTSTTTEYGCVPHLHQGAD